MATGEKESAPGTNVEEEHQKLLKPGGGPANLSPQMRQPLQEEGSQEQQLGLQLGDIKLISTL